MEILLFILYSIYIFLLGMKVGMIITKWSKKTIEEYEKNNKNEKQV